MTDNELVELARNDNEEAKEELFRRCKKVISFNVVKYKGMFYGPIEADDLIAECHIAVMEAILLYNPDRGANFSTFSGFIIRTRILQFLKHKTKQLKNEITDFELEKLPIKDNPIQYIRIKNGLNERDKNIIKLFLEGEKQSDLARQFNVSRTRIGQIIKEGLEK